MNTIRHLSQYAFQELKGSYEEPEIRSLCRLIFTDAFKYTNIDIHLRKNEILPETFTFKFVEIIQKLKAGLPLQYILGETEFAGLRFQVNSSTLIPRPETEELVWWAKEVLRPSMKVLDIGTGSGCIIISLAKLCPGIQAYGLDICQPAIDTAQQNARQNGVKVTFQKGDILQDILPFSDTFQVLVSNPPYVRESEKQQMQPQVLDHEPAQALFVPDEDPLLYYRHIARWGQILLEEGGYLFFEINEALGSQVVALLDSWGYRETELRKDIFDKDRMVKSRK